MAWIQDDLDRIKRAIAQGVRRVQFKDRLIEYKLDQRDADSPRSHRERPQRPGCAGRRRDPAARLPGQNGQGLLMRMLRYKKPVSLIIGLDGKPLAVESRAYEASAQGRRLGSFNAPDLSPNQAATAELTILRRRMRASVRNNPWISRELKADVANETGTGIIPRSKVSNKAFRKAIRTLWNDWLPFADADGILNAYGIQWSAARGRKEAGEAFIRIRQRRPGRTSTRCRTPTSPGF